MTQHRIIIGDVLDGLRSLDAGSCRCCVTSPPYWGLRDYGVEGQIGLEATPEEYVAKMVAVFREVRRVLADDGTLWLNLGDCYATGAGKVGVCPGGGDQGERWRGGHEGKHGTVGPMTQPNRMPIDGFKPKDLVGIPWTVAFALRADGWYLRSDIIWHKPNPMPESVTDRPTKAHEYIFLLSKSERYYYDADAIRIAPEAKDARVARSSESQRGRSTRRTDMEAYGLTRGKTNQPCSHPNGANARSVWRIATQPYPEAHFATFPEELPTRCIKAGSAVGDWILDPFCGSGTTLAMARLLGRNGVGCELNPEYAAMAEDRIGRTVTPASYVSKRGEPAPLFGGGM